MLNLIRIFVKYFFSFHKKHFLVLLQNNNELRSTGGYVTSVFDVTVGGFSLRKKALNVNTDLYQHKKVRAPEMIEKMLYDGHLDTWTFRDANYSPDIHDSSKKMIEFYHLVYPKHQVCGLFYINYSFIEGLLKVLGGITWRYETIDHLNCFDFLSSRVSDIDRHDINDISKRKNILNGLFGKIFFITILSPWKWPAVSSLITRSFKSKDLQLYDSGKKADSCFSPNKNQDFLAVIENNYLGLKNNRYIRKIVSHHSIINTDGILINQVRTSWEHFGIRNYPLGGTYRAHIRFFLPREAEIINSDQYEITREDHLTVVNFVIYLKPQERSDIEFGYRYPSHFIDDHYSFRFFKQPGVYDELLRKSFVLPVHLQFDRKKTKDFKENMIFKNYYPVEQDCHFYASFKKSDHFPRIYSHHITAPDTIQIKFNEPVYADDKKGTRIRVFKKNQPEEGIDVEALEFNKDSRILRVKLKNLPQDAEHFYTVEIKNLINKNGVSLNPNPRTLTVVYRPEYFV